MSNIIVQSRGVNGVAIQITVYMVPFLTFITVELFELNNQGGGNKCPMEQVEGVICTLSLYFIAAGAGKL